MSKDFEKDKLDNYDKHSVVTFVNKLAGKNTYHCVIKQHFWEKASYKDFFYFIRNLRDQLVSDGSYCISMPYFEDTFTQFKNGKLKRIIQYIFRDLKIRIFVHLNKIKQPNLEEIPIILKKNHESPHSGHSGNFKTYHRIKTMYRWKG